MSDAAVGTPPPGTTGSPTGTASPTPPAATPRRPTAGGWCCRCWPPGVRRQQRYLDIGSGQGDLAVDVAHRWTTAEIAGIELSRRGVEIATGKLPRGRFIQFDLVSRQAPPAGFGGWATHATCSEVLEHVDDPDRLLASARRWLAPGRSAGGDGAGRADVRVRSPRRPSPPLQNSRTDGTPRGHRLLGAGVRRGWIPVLQPLPPGGHRPGRPSRHRCRRHERRATFRASSRWACSTVCWPPARHGAAAAGSSTPWRGWRSPDGDSPMDAAFLLVTGKGPNGVGPRCRDLTDATQPVGLGFRSARHVWWRNESGTVELGAWQPEPMVPDAAPWRIDHDRVVMAIGNFDGVTQGGRSKDCCLDQLARTTGRTLLRDVAGELDGVFALVAVSARGDVDVATDPVGLRCVYYGEDDDVVAVSSKATLVAGVLAANGGRPIERDCLHPCWLAFTSYWVGNRDWVQRRARAARRRGVSHQPNRLPINPRGRIVGPRRGDAGPPRGRAHRAR